MKTVLVLNTGSSSLKASLLLACNKSASKAPHTRLITAHGERLGTQYSSLRISISVDVIDKLLSSSVGGSPGKSTNIDYFHDSARILSEDFVVPSEDKKKIKIFETYTPKMRHEDAIKRVVTLIKAQSEVLFSSIVAVGHRVVHGGLLSDAVVIDETVLQSIEDATHLAPLHNPSNIQGIKLSWLGEFKALPNVAVFDTAFHSTIPQKAHMYPIPEEYRANGIRKYGFHGTSVKYVSKMAMDILKSHDIVPRHSNDSYRLVIVHLGNGGSVTAVVDGKSVDTTMEFTPLSGIMMGSRSGSIDPSIVTYAMDKLEKSADEVINDLNTKSGLKGLTCENDMRVIESRILSGDQDAKLALEMYVYTLSKYVASMMIACGGYIDALVFTAGIGENSPLVRKMTIESIGDFLGPDVHLDDSLNKLNGIENDGIISDTTGGPAIMVVPTDEETMICLECERLVDIH